MPNSRRLLVVDLSVYPAVYRPPDGNAPADLAPYSHAILTGSEASILADTEWIVRACDLTRALDARGVKLLGSCLGHQMLGRALSDPGGRRVTTPGGPRALGRRRR